MRIIFLFILIGWSIHVCGQEVQAPAGDYSTSPSISLSWTLGETISETGSGSGIVLTQGFQQPHFLITTIKEQLKGVGVSVYPNPAAGMLNVQFISETFRKVIIELYSMSGQLVHKEAVEIESGTRILKIDLDALANGQYKLVLNEENNSAQSVYTIQRVK
jgi:hypothetical protein